ncbi:MAG: class I SAM-dependent methyltransferase [Defluviitaleaceae bacterium]|nr:class I SAM-dependent methyltransferase [Defluviitaleaceae bacterium]
MYNQDLAKKYWESRITGNDGDRSVLYYSENSIVNDYYDRWEKRVIIDHIGDSLSSKNILDIPVGSGRWTNALLERGGIIDCVDISQKIINVAKNNSNIFDTSKLNYNVSTVKELSYKKKSFDYILCTGLFEHLPEEDYLFATGVFSNMLKKEGLIILVVNNKYNKLLHVKKDNPYRKSNQLENGYYGGITDIDKIFERFEKEKISIEKCAANPMFSALRHLCKNIKSHDTLEQIYKNALENDVMLFGELDNIKNIISDQIIIFGRKK